MEEDIMVKFEPNLMEREKIVKELVPIRNEGGAGDPDTFEYDDVKYKFMMAFVDDEIVAITQIKILETPEDEEKEYQEVATFHMHKDAFIAFHDMVDAFKRKMK
jgi:phosphate uptake regulator